MASASAIGAHPEMPILSRLWAAGQTSVWDGYRILFYWGGHALTSPKVAGLVLLVLLTTRLLHI